MTVSIGQPSNDQELDAAFNVRRQVFVLEQGVPLDEELDALDATAEHLVAIVDGEVVGTCRVLMQTPDKARIGRMAVLEPFRGRGIARELLVAGEGAAADRGAQRVVLDAQLTALPFYEHSGYVANGPVFLDAGIEHRAMTRDIG